MTRPRFTRDRLLAFALALVLFVADQRLKQFVIGTLGLRSVGDHHDLSRFFDFTRTNNFGVSLGMFEANSMEMRYVLIAVTGAIAIGVMVWIMRETRRWDIYALAMILGGALGNILDRYRLGYVVDFADFHIGEFRPFLIFNLADAAITVGVVILLARALFIGEKPATEQDETTGADQATGD
ncbi:MAG: signal peptidase II [Alteraurantiacibacter sp.]